MIKDILDALEFDFRGKYIDVAKGKYKLPETLREGYNQIIAELWKK